MPPRTLAFSVTSETAAKAFWVAVAIASSAFALWVMWAGYYPWKHGPVYRDTQPVHFWFRVIFLFGVTAFLFYALFFYHPTTPIR